MSSIGDRVHQIRKEAGLTMEKFGKRIGVVKSTVFAIEKGVSLPSERVIRLICYEFRVNHDWLTKGEGEKYSIVPNAILDRLIEEYHLGDTDKRIIRAYLHLSNSQKKVLSEFFQIIIDMDEKEQIQ